MELLRPAILTFSVDCDVVVDHQHYRPSYKYRVMKALCGKLPKGYNPEGLIVTDDFVYYGNDSRLCSVEIDSLDIIGGCSTMCVFSFLVHSTNILPVEFWIDGLWLKIFVLCDSLPSLLRFFKASYYDVSWSVDDDSCLRANFENIVRRYESGLLLKDDDVDRVYRLVRLLDEQSVGREVF